MSQDPFAVPNVPSVNMDASKAQRLAGDRAEQNAQISQEESQISLQNFIDEGAFSPTMIMRRFETLETRRRQISKEEEAKKAEKQEQQIVAIEQVEQIAQDFGQRNKELNPRALQLLLSRLTPQDSQEEILQKVLELYPDPWLADEALSFLEVTTSGALKEQVLLARKTFYDHHDKQIRAGRNIQKETDTFSKEGLGAPTALRALYKEMTTNPKDANTLFQEFSSQLDFDKMKTMISFLLHALGSDLKSKGPSIPRGELHILFSEARKLQAILGVFFFFKARMGLITSAFQREGLALTLTFEILAKQLMRLIQEKYPSADRILLIAQQLGISKELLAQIILFTQMRDAMRHIAMRLFRSNQHRQDLLNALMDALEELEEQLEEEKEKDQEEGEEQDDG